MTPYLKAASYLPNPDDQIWELLVPSPPDPQQPRREGDDVDTMVENGED
jgi:hypothetical protein